MSGLRDTQLNALVELDAACSAMFYAQGFDAAEVTSRSVADFATLARSHAVHVAEADYVVAGYLAWRDESPGVAYLADIAVHPDYQRFGVGTRLLEEMRDDARGHHFEQIVVRCWQRAGWAMAFYAANGFVPLDASAAPKVRTWFADREASGRPVVRPGEVILWSEVGEPPPEERPTTEGSFEFE